MSRQVWIHLVTIECKMEQVADLSNCTVTSYHTLEEVLLVVTLAQRSRMIGAP